MSNIIQNTNDSTFKIGGTKSSRQLSLCIMNHPESDGISGPDEGSSGLRYDKRYMNRVRGKDLWMELYLGKHIIAKITFQ